MFSIVYVRNIYARGRVISEASDSIPVVYKTSAMRFNTENSIIDAYQTCITSRYNSYRPIGMNRFISKGNGASR